jgi:hypothetical protein
VGASCTQLWTAAAAAAGALHACEGGLTALRHASTQCQPTQQQPPLSLLILPFLQSHAAAATKPWTSPEGRNEGVLLQNQSI